MLRLPSLLEERGCFNPSCSIVEVLRPSFAEAVNVTLLLIGLECLCSHWGEVDLLVLSSREGLGPTASCLDESCVSLVLVVV